MPRFTDRSSPNNAASCCSVEILAIFGAPQLASRQRWLSRHRPNPTCRQHSCARRAEQTSFALILPSSFTSPIVRTPTPTCDHVPRPPGARQARAMLQRQRAECGPIARGRADGLLMMRRQTDTSWANETAVTTDNRRHFPRSRTFHVAAKPRPEERSPSANRWRSSRTTSTLCGHWRWHWSRATCRARPPLRLAFGVPTEGLARVSPTPQVDYSIARSHFSELGL